MALIEWYRDRPSGEAQQDLLTAIHEITPELYRVDLQEPKADISQECEYVRLPIDGSTFGPLMLKVFYEGQRIVAIEFVVPNVDQPTAEALH